MLSRLRASLFIIATLALAACSDRSPTNPSALRTEHSTASTSLFSDPDPAVAIIGQWNLPQGDTTTMHYQLLPRLTDGSITGVALVALQSQIAAVRAAAAASPGARLSLTLGGSVMLHASGRITQQLTQDIVAP
jgi:microcystin degradation protein MlrC